MHSLFPAAQIGSKLVPDALDSKFKSDIKREDSSIFLLASDDRVFPQLGSIVERMRSIERETPLLLVHPEESEEVRLRALKMGASGYFSPTQTGEQIRKLILGEIEKAGHKSCNRGSGYEWQKHVKIIGSSLSFQRILDQLPVAGESSLPVLLTGETGTGKEVAARAIHYLSPRHGETFETFQCAAVAQDLFENDLFGHEAGSYTDARGAQEGVVATAEKGTLLLDEIDTLAPHHQPKILRLLQEHEYRPIGAPKAIKADIRVLAATNADLPGLIKKGSFRSDLFYRISVINITLPPLRERRDDIPELASYFLKLSSSKSKDALPTLSDSALSRLIAYNWPGNVRELCNVIQHSALYVKGGRIEADDLKMPVEACSCEILSFKRAKRQMIDEFERSYFRDLLSKSRWNVSQAAKLALIDRSVLCKKMRVLGIPRPDSIESDKQPM